MNEKQQQLTFDKGITNVPSDALCSDNALAESVGMVYDDGEHRVIQKPNPFITSVSGGLGAIPRILFVHRFNNQERFIGYYTTEGHAPYYLCWGTVANSAYSYNGSFIMDNSERLQYTSSTQISSIGKTLIILDSNGISYYLWKTNAYEYLPDIPEPDVEFQMYYGSFGQSSALINASVHNTAPAECLTYNESRNEIDVREDRQEDYNNLVVGLYSKNLKAIAHRKAFAEPFFVRYALEMYDGSYTMISAPMLMFPSVHQNTRAQFWDDRVVLLTIFSEMIFVAKHDYTKYSDLVRGVTVFVTDGVNLYDTVVDQTPTTLNVANTMWSDYICYDSGYGKHVVDQRGTTQKYFLPLKLRSDKSILNDLESTGQFYKVFSLGLVGNNTWESSASYIGEHVLDNLTTQNRLEYDDYYSHCDKSAKSIYSYNGRLILANVLRGFFEGYSHFIGYPNTSTSYDVYVWIKTDVGDRIVHKTITSTEKLWLYFYYPDPRAYKVQIGDTPYNLKEHGSLNGAYYMMSTLPVGNETGPGVASSTPTTNTTEEYLENHIYMSEVNNPFVFYAQGDYTVGTGRIFGITSLTTALSQGQFGEYPLLAFSSSGIWALSIASTGYFTACHPMSREVALENNPCLTQTDGAVFFASKKGLMVVVGNQVKCVSEQLSGKKETFVGVTDLGNFVDFLNTAIIAYDYRDSMLWIFDKTHTACWVYSIKSGTFGKYEFGTSKAVTNVVNYYPDYLIQNPDGVHSLARRLDINNDTGTYAGTIISRPMKFENSLALKSLVQVRNIYDISHGAGITLQIYVSNNLHNWMEVHSLRGMPWKYFRFRFNFTTLKANDHFDGSLIISQERRTNKLR